MLCQFRTVDVLCDGTRVHRCERCGVSQKSRTVAERCYRTCGKRGLGDWLAWLLAKFGVRQRPRCGCARRQEKVNRWGERLRKWWGQRRS